MKTISQARLDADDKIRDRMEELLRLSETDTPEYRKLHQQYYIDNDDIRMYWKTY